jgi:5'-nucleotidase
MPYSVENKLVVAIASSALFDLTESGKVFAEHGELAYRQHQRENENVPLAPGVAFPFIRRLLKLNLDPAHEGMSRSLLNLRA